MSKKNGETAVIGGIHDVKKIHVFRGVPFLSSLPLIGALFRSNQTQANQFELLIMITPTILQVADKDSGSGQSYDDPGATEPDSSSNYGDTGESDSRN